MLPQPFREGQVSVRPLKGERGELPPGGIPRQDLLGGPTGGELIVGGFPAWTRKSQIIDWGDEYVKPALSEDLRGKLEENSAPGKRGSILIRRMSQESTKFETRKSMFAAVKEINGAKILIKALGEEHALWSGPSKPAYRRQQDQMVTEALNIMRRIVDNARLDVDYP